MTSFLVLGCGYTGKRVARRLLSRGERVLVTAHGADGLVELRRLGARVQLLEAADERSLRGLAGAASSDGRLRVLCSIPPLRQEGRLRDATGDLLRVLGAHVERVAYLSTTSVYGDAEDVDEHTAAAPRDEAGRLRLAAEQAAADGPWPALVLRAAAIYGPGRGVQTALRAGTARLRAARRRGAASKRHELRRVADPPVGATRAEAPRWDRAGRRSGRGRSRRWTVRTSGVQAVRAVFRYGGTQSPCPTGGHDDRDDLVFVAQ